MWCPNDKKDFFLVPGQIVPQGEVGQLIIKTIQEPLKNIVEIGTWNGLGSTKCFLLGLQDSTQFYTLESNEEKVIEIEIIPGSGGYSFATKCGCLI